MVRLVSVLIASILVANTADAAITKLICKNINGFGEAGPLEIDLGQRVVYRYVQRQQWPITSVTDTYITLMNLNEVGGGLAVLDLQSGELLVAKIGLYPDMSQGGAGPIKLQVLDMTPMICSKGLLSD